MLFNAYTLPSLMLFLLTATCVSSEKTTMGREDYDSKSGAHAAAYRVDAMHTRTLMERRPDWRPVEFYFKHCSRMSESSHFSKTEYECSGPY